MGNRAVITTGTKLDYENNVGIYLHWNGGRDSIEAFLKYCKMRDFRGGSYGMARLTQVIANFFDGGLGIGLGVCKELDCDNWDNGVYIIDPDSWTIIDRDHNRNPEQNNHKLDQMVKDIDEAQPVKDQLTDPKILELFEKNR
jgi:hypothetical protein